MKTAYKKLEKWYIFLMILAIILIILASAKIFESVLIQQQNKEIGQIASVVGNAINISVESETLIQNFWIEKLEQISHEIEKDLKGKSIASLSDEELLEIQNKYALSGVAFFLKNGQDIVIEKSTSKAEVGLSTSGWGFWHDAFLQLFETGKVQLDKGVSKPKFWAGPRSLAHEQEGFFLFTYYALEGTPYLLNLYVNDQEAFGVLKEHDPNLLIDNLIEQYDYLQEVAVINVEAWNNRFLEENRFKLQDFTVNYGSYRNFAAQDTYYINMAAAKAPLEKVETKLTFKKDIYKKVYIKINKTSVIVLLIDTNSIMFFKNQLMFIIIGGIIGVVIISMILIRYYTKHYTSILSIEHKRLKNAERFKSTVTLLPSLVFRLKRDNQALTIVHCEGKGLRYLNINSKDCDNAEAKSVLPETYFQIIMSHAESIQPKTVHHFEVQLEDKLFYHHLECIESEDGSDMELLLFANDVTRLRKSEEEAKYLAMHDSLTQLPNRLYFKNEVDRRIELGETFAVAFLDMDGFKEVNDSAGHDVGDLLIIEISRRLLGNIDVEDFCSRMGGDEFALVLKAYSDEKLLKVKKALAEPYHFKGYTFYLTASIGLSRYPQDASDYTTLLKNADIAMYQVKDSGKNNFKMNGE